MAAVIRGTSAVASGRASPKRAMSAPATSTQTAAAEIRNLGPDSWWNTGLATAEGNVIAQVNFQPNAIFIDDTTRAGSQIDYPMICGATTCQKLFPPTEQVRLGDRLEMFNAWNHINYWMVAATVGNANFGQVTSAMDPRILQMALRLEF